MVNFKSAQTAMVSIKAQVDEVCTRPTEVKIENEIILHVFGMLELKAIPTAIGRFYMISDSAI